MNRSALKTYAPKARLDFIRAVTDRAAFFGLTPKRTEPMQETGDVVIIGGRAFPKVVVQQRRSLEGRIQRQGFDQVMEAMAYTWFNRFVALRYMELHGYLDHGYRVLSHPEGKATPEIVEHAEHVTLPGLDAQQVINLKLDGTKEAELYRLLLVAQCNALHQAMPFLFEKIADETELLLPDNLLHSDSVIRKLVNEIEEADWQQVEIIGWLYQHYVNDEKATLDSELKKGKAVASKDIPAKTQLFTHNWIVKYLLQNSLGHQWLTAYPDSALRQLMEYYIEPAEQTDEVKAQLATITPKALDPETLTLLDDACGSGHILVEAYDLFKAIYQERGYRSKDIPRLILQKNLFGLEIDDRAAQLAAFALLMKARADDRRIFDDRIQPNVLAIQDSKGLESLLTLDPGVAAVAGNLPFADSDLFPDTKQQLTLNKPTKGSPLAEVEPCLRELIKLFEHGKTFGSLIRVPPALVAQLPAARQSIEAMIAKQQLWEHQAAAILSSLVKQAELLASRFDVVVANPPYLGGKGLPDSLKQFAKEQFLRSKADLYSMFIERGFDLATPTGYNALITMETWMFLYSYEQMREHTLRDRTIQSLVHMPYEGRGKTSLGINFGTAATIFRCRPINGYKAHFCYVRHTDITEDGFPVEFPVRNNRLGYQVVDHFSQIPGAPVAYWLCNAARQAFVEGSLLETIAPPKIGMRTGDNTRFLRRWHEVSLSRIGLGFRSAQEALASQKKWFPYNKGGDFRRWYGNNDYVVNWERDGAEIKAETKKKYPDLGDNLGWKISNESFYFLPAITWTFVSSASFGVRKTFEGFLFDVGGSCTFPQPSDLNFVLGFLCSKVALYFMQALNPSLNFQVGDVAKLPVLTRNLSSCRARISDIVDQCVMIYREDWDLYETSWDFQQMALLQPSGCRTVGDSWSKWEKTTTARRDRVNDLERQLNRLFVGAYGLEGELSIDVTEGEITLARASRVQDAQRLISYSIGCMMGRYSLDKPGLVYAHSRNEGFDASQYRTFPADADGIIPLSELAWFPDDATERFVEFIAKAWPREHLEENLKFIADSLGPNRDEHPRDTIRRYLATGFYKDHLSTYKKRPIYWLFFSGKQRAFQCLVYLHRYHDGTLARMRTEYVIPLQGKIAHRIEQLAGDITAATSSSHRRKLEKEKGLCSRICG